MSSDKIIDEQKITTVVKTKDPKRVEAGEKLAALSKAAREEKKQQRMTMEEKPMINYTVEKNIGLIGVVGLVVAVGSLWFTYKAYAYTKTDSIHAPQQKETTIKPVEPPAVEEKNSLENL